MVKGKTTNGLMRHLRNNHGISIGGSKNKIDLMNMGYYHGYKGYRFIREADNFIPYSNFDEIVAVYNFDTNLKAIFYPHIMMIETAIKNRTLETLINKGPVDFDQVFENLLTDYQKHNVGNRDYRDKMKTRLDLRNKINESIADNYAKNKAVIQHFFHSDKPIPLWAIFEVIELGVFGFFIQCLNEKTRIDLAKDLNMHSTAHNQNGRILEWMIYSLKELRNAVAHNSVIFDCRFKSFNQKSQLKEYLQKETKVPNISFVHIVDYLIIIIFLLKKLNVRKNELKRLIRQCKNESEKLRNAIPASIHSSIMGTEFRKKIEHLEYNL